MERGDQQFLSSYEIHTIYIYIYRERERERENAAALSSSLLFPSPENLILYSSFFLSPFLSRALAAMQVSLREQRESEMVSVAKKELQTMNDR